MNGRYEIQRILCKEYARTILCDIKKSLKINKQKRVNKKFNDIKDVIQDTMRF